MALLQSLMDTKAYLQQQPHSVDSINLGVVVHFESEYALAFEYACVAVLPP